MGKELDVTLEDEESAEERLAEGDGELSLGRIGGGGHFSEELCGEENEEFCRDREERDGGDVKD